MGETYTLTVTIQENGMIYDPFGRVMGECKEEWLLRMLNRPPYGLTVSEDGKLINWCGENYEMQKKEGK